MWTVYQVILLILSLARANETSGKQEHNVTKREIDPQIIGGSPVSMPTAVLILIKPDKGITNSCSGTVLSEDVVLSAGHCFDIPGSYANVTTVVAGVSDLRNYLTGKPNIAQEFNVSKVTIHPLYRHVDGVPGKKEELIWDLAIIKLSSKMEIETNPNIEAVKLPPPGLKHVGKKVQVGGWGRYTPHSAISLIHQAIDVTIKPAKVCSNIYDVGEFSASQMFCAGEKGHTTCRGDSGSGAIFHWNNKKIIIGVLSFGIKGCTTASVFQRVEQSLPWIFRESNLRPAYEVFLNDELFEEFVDDVAVDSPTTQTGECGMVIYGRSYQDTGSRMLQFSAYHILNEEEEFWYDYPSQTSHTNYWITDLGKTGADARLYIAFACPKSMNGFRIKNTHNAEYQNMGTNKFKIFKSKSGSGPWTEILSGNLPDARNVSPVPVLQFNLKSPTTTKVIMFQIESFYGLGGGLQYFSTF